jgi:cell division protein FtsL
MEIRFLFRHESFNTIEEERKEQREKYQHAYGNYEKSKSEFTRIEKIFHVEIGQVPRD